MTISPNELPSLWRARAERVRKGNYHERANACADQMDWDASELEAALSARDAAGACNCASGRGAEHCVVHAPNDVLPSIATPPASGEAAPNMQKCAGCGSEWPDYLFKDGKCIKCRKTTPPAASGDDFNGDNAKLIGCIEALLSLDAANALVPHGIGGHARTLLFAAARRLAAVAPAGMEAVTEEMLARAHAGFDAAVTEWNEQQLGERGINIGDYAMRGALTAALAARTGKGEA